MATKLEWWKQPEVSAVLNPQRPVFNGNVLPVGNTNGNQNSVMADMISKGIQNPYMQNVAPIGGGQQDIKPDINDPNNFANYTTKLPKTTPDFSVNPISGKSDVNTLPTINQPTNIKTINPININPNVNTPKNISNVNDITKPDINDPNNFAKYTTKLPKTVPDFSINPISGKPDVNTLPTINQPNVKNEPTIGITPITNIPTVTGEVKPIETKKETITPTDPYIEYIKQIMQGNNPLFDTWKNLYAQDVSGAGAAATQGLMQQAAMAGMSPEAIASMGIARARDVESNISRGLGELTAKNQEQAIAAAKTAHDMTMAGNQFELTKQGIDYNKQVDAMKQLLASGDYKGYADMYKKIYGVDIDTTELKNTKNQAAYSNLMNNINKMIAQGLSWDDAWKIISKDGSLNGIGLTENDVKKIYENTKLNTNQIYKYNQYVDELISQKVITPEQGKLMKNLAVWGLTHPDGFTISESYEIYDKDGKLVKNFQTKSEADAYMKNNPNSGYTVKQNPYGWIGLNTDTTVVNPTNLTESYEILDKDGKKINNFKTKSEADAYVKNNPGTTINYNPKGWDSSKINKDITTLQGTLQKLNIMADQERIQEYLDSHDGKWDPNMTAKDWNEWDAKTGSYARIRDVFAGRAVNLQEGDKTLLADLKAAQTRIDSGTGTDADKKMVEKLNGVKFANSIYKDNDTQAYIKIKDILLSDKELTDEDMNFFLKYHYDYNRIITDYMKNNPKATLKEAFTKTRKELGNSLSADIPDLSQVENYFNNPNPTTTGDIASAPTGKGVYHAKYSSDDNIYDAEWSKAVTHEMMSDESQRKDHKLPHLHFNPSTRKYIEQNTDRMIKIKDKYYQIKGIKEINISSGGMYAQFCEAVELYDPSTGKTTYETFGSTSQSSDDPL